MDIQNVNLQTALHLAVERQHTQIVRVRIYYENMPRQNTDIFSAVKIENISRKILTFLLKT